MRSRSVIVRFAAFFVMLVFAQKTGVGLFLHTVLHAQARSENGHPGSKDSSVAYGCTCVDDLLLPFTETDPQWELPSLPTPQVARLVYQETVSFRTAIFTSLRGPPTVIA